MTILCPVTPTVELLYNFPMYVEKMGQCCEKKNVKYFGISCLFALPLCFSPHMKQFVITDILISNYDNIHTAV